MTREVWVNEEECISCGLCIDNLPTVFRYALDGKAECFDPAGASAHEIQSEAIDICPVACIHWK